MGLQSQHQQQSQLRYGALDCAFKPNLGASHALDFNLFMAWAQLPCGNLELFKTLPVWGGWGGGAVFYWIVPICFLPLQPSRFPAGLSGWAGIMQAAGEEGQGPLTEEASHSTPPFTQHWEIQPGSKARKNKGEQDWKFLPSQRYNCTVVLYFWKEKP